MLSFFGKKKMAVAISPSIVVFSTFFFACLVFLYRIKEILVILFLGFLLMVALTPTVNRLERKLKSRLLSILLAYILLLLIISATLAVLIPPLAIQLTLLLKNVQLPFLQNELSNLKFSIQELNQLASNYGGSINALLSIITSTFKGLFTFLTLTVISFYMMIDQPNLYKKVGWFTTNKNHVKIAREFMIDLENQIGNWIRGKLIVMIFVGLFTFIGLELIGIPYALPLGIIAFVLEILPNLGPTLAAVPGILIAWLHGDHISALIVLIFYIVLQQIENNFLTPRVMKTSADVNPLISILSILSGLTLGGFIGGLLAIPIYILIRIIFGYYRQYQSKLSPDWQ